MSHVLGLQSDFCSLAQARTGTGKTLAFLIPVVQNLINHDPSLAVPTRSSHRRPQNGFGALVISPTRELAEQIATEARKLTQHTGIMVQTAVGGQSKRLGLRQIQNGCDLLVGCPGRLKDILSDPYCDVRAPGLSTFVLDEADRLLEQGFEPEIQAIQRFLPDKSKVPRQTLLFSATVPQEVMPIVRTTLNKDFQYITTVQKGEQPTHEKVPQKLVRVGGLEKQMTTLVELCLRQVHEGKKETPFKSIIFFPTVAEVRLASKVLIGYQRSHQGGENLVWPRSTRVIALHSQLAQYQRSENAASFKEADSAVLLATDVAARGMDFPNVTHVIQLGLPQAEEHYVHRIGRTARAGKTGEAWLLISDLERREVRNRLGKMPLTPDMSLSTPAMNTKRDSDHSDPFSANIHSKLLDVYKSVPEDDKSAAHISCLGVYQWLGDKNGLIEALNTRATDAWGMEPPPIASSLARKLGLLGAQGLRIDDRPPPRSMRDGGPPRRNSSWSTDRPRQSREYAPRSSSSREYEPRSNFGQDYSPRSSSSREYAPRSSSSREYSPRSGSSGSRRRATRPEPY